MKRLMMIAILIVMVNIVKGQTTVDSTIVDTMMKQVEMSSLPTGEMGETIPIQMNVASIVLLILGWLIHVGVKFNKRSDKTSAFNIKKYWEENWIRELIGLLSAIAVIIIYSQTISIINTLKLDISKIPSNLIKYIIYFHPVIMFVIGWFNHSLITSLISKVTSKVKIDDEE